MTIKTKRNELSLVRSLMTMSLNAIVADVFNLELDELNRELNLIADLAMDATKQQELSTLIAEYFDGLTVDFDQIQTLDDLFQTVVNVEFELLPTESFYDN
jgi:hypothetical protein